MNNKTFQILISVASAFILWMTLLIFADLSNAIPGLKRIFQLLGGIYGGYIHILIYTAFIYGIIELTNNHKFIKQQYEGFDLNLLPVEEQSLLSSKEVSDIKQSASVLEESGFRFLVSDFIKKTCTQYRNDQSVGESLQMLDAQIDNSKGELESRLEMVRYMINAIVSLGFIGTLIGLSAAIGKSYLARTQEGMPELTGYLNVAFDTTLVALMLGLVLNFFFHRYLENLDTFYVRSKSYIIDNLISRIYVT